MRSIVCALVTLLLFLTAHPLAAQKKKGKSKGIPKKVKPTEAQQLRDTLESMTAFKGLLNVYQDQKTGAAWMLIDRNQIGEEFIYFTHTVNGVVDVGHFKGNFRDNKVFRIEKYFDRIEFVTPATGFYFPDNHPLKRAQESNTSPAILASQHIEFTDSSQGKYLIKADGLFLKEMFHQVKPSYNPDYKGPPRFKLGKLSPDKTKYVAIRNYPENTDVIVDYVYENPTPLRGGGKGVTDSRNISIRLQHSLIKMPKNDFQPRFDDGRIGFFTTQTTDMTSREITPYRDMVNRWHLVKKDPSAALSEPVEPIVWWIENTTPTEFRGPVRRAAEAWNLAFEEAGFKNALVVKVQPDDADWDAGDIRYNVLRWTSSPEPPFGGYGPRFVNPRTGQILGADVMLEYAAVTRRMRRGLLLRSTDSWDLDAWNDLEPDQPFLPASAWQAESCMAGSHLFESMQFAFSLMDAGALAEVDEMTVIKAAISYVVLHELGHTLGLNHNMKASNLHSPAQLHDTERTRKMGLVGSVMDYPALNVSSDPKIQGDFYTTRPGPYDGWAIQFGYATEMDNPAKRAALLNRSTEPELTFGNDADDMRSPGRGIDPRIQVRDLSSDALSWADDRMTLCDRSIEGIYKNYTQTDASYEALVVNWLSLNYEYRMASNAVSRYIGGVYQDRAYAGTPNAAIPLQPVPEAEQKRALDILNRHLFAPDAWKESEQLYQHLLRQRRGFSHFGRSEDPKIHQRALSLQRIPLYHLTHHSTLKRITDSGLYGNTYSLGEMMGDLTDAIFLADRSNSVNSFRRNLQVDYTQRLIVIYENKKKVYDPSAVAMAWYTLTQLEKDLKKSPGSDIDTKAHREYLVHLIQKTGEK